MVVFFWMLGIIIWVAIALWPARVAASKGHSFWGYFLLSIPLWWITLFIVYFGLKDKPAAKAPAADAA